MKSRTLSLLSTLGICGFVATAQAARHASEQSASRGQFGFVGELDAEFGGDDLVEITFTNGRSQTLHAGQGLALNGGLHFRPGGSNFDFVGTVGYKYVTTAASNADIRLERVVLKLQGYYDFNRGWWVSAGPVWHTGVRFSGDGFLSDVSFSDAVGATFQFGWRWVGIGYTNISYEAERPFRGKVDASNFGIYLQWRGQ